MSEETEFEEVSEGMQQLQDTLTNLEGQKVPSESIPDSDEKLLEILKYLGIRVKPNIDSLVTVIAEKKFKEFNESYKAYRDYFEKISKDLEIIPLKWAEIYLFSFKPQDLVLTYNDNHISWNEKISINHWHFEDESGLLKNSSNTVRISKHGKFTVKTSNGHSLKKLGFLTNIRFDLVLPRQEMDKLQAIIQEIEDKNNEFYQKWGNQKIKISTLKSRIKSKIETMKLEMLPKDMVDTLENKIKQLE